MKKHQRKGGTIAAIIIIISLIAAAVGWGVLQLWNRMTEYGSSATIVQPPEEEQEQSYLDADGTETEEKPAIPENKYASDGFYDRNGLKCYYKAGIRGVPGIDVSSHQQDIDWKAVKEAGVEFAMIRIGYRGYVSGEIALDEFYEQNMTGAAENEIPVGVYFFSQALTEEEAVEEAEFVLEWIRDYDIQYPVIFDWEEVEAQARTDEMNMLLLTKCTKAFCDTISEAGYNAGVYFNQAYGYQQLNLPSLQEYVFWLAEYDDYPSFLYDFQMWQYTCTGTVSGINGPVDLNIAFSKED